MHEIIREHLERYLEGRCSPDRLAEIQAHLAGCAGCRTTLEQFEGSARMLRLLRPPAEKLVPPPGFYQKVMKRIETSRQDSFWSFLLDPVFGRRLVYASLALVAILSSFLFSSSSGNWFEVAVSAPETILAQPAGSTIAEDAGAVDQNRDAILVTLATYQD